LSPHEDGIFVVGVSLPDNYPEEAPKFYSAPLHP
jgi:ubiquitin-protein ligase